MHVVGPTEGRENGYGNVENAGDDGDNVSVEEPGTSDSHADMPFTKGFTFERGSDDCYNQRKKKTLSLYA